MTMHNPWAKLKISKAARAQFKISLEDLDAFAKLSGDYNPIHLDESYARKKGFKGRVVYGAMMIAAVSRLLGMKIPGPGCLWQSVSLQFTSPLYVDEVATVVGKISYSNPELSVLRLAIEIKARGRQIARGEAQASLIQ